MHNTAHVGEHLSCCLVAEGKHLYVVVQLCERGVGGRASGVNVDRESAQRNCTKGSVRWNRQLRGARQDDSECIDRLSCRAQPRAERVSMSGVGMVGVREAVADAVVKEPPAQDERAAEHAEAEDLDESSAHDSTGGRG